MFSYPVKVNEKISCSCQELQKKKMLVFCGIKFVLNSLCVQLQLKVARGKQNGQSHQCGGRKQKNTKINSKKTKSKLLLLKNCIQIYSP